MATYAVRGLGSTLILNDTTGYLTLVGGQAVMVIAGSLLIDSAIGRPSQASFVVRTAAATTFAQWTQVVIYDASNFLVFSGYITTPKAQKPGFQSSLLHSITCIDQHFLADKRRISASYVNKTCGFIVQDILNNILAAEGVTIGQIYDGLTPEPTLYPSTTLYPGGNVGLIPQANFVYATVSQALDALVQEASAAGVPYYWQIDQFKQLWFVPYTTVVNSTIIDGVTIDQAANPPSVTNANPTYRNQQTILGGVAQTVTQTEVRKGDGNTQSFTMGYALASAPTITVNGTSQTVGIKGTTGKQWYWAQGDPVVVQDSGQTKLISTDTLQVVYIGQYPSVAIAANNAQISYQASIDGTSGIVEDVAVDNTLSTAANALSEASNLLTRYAQQGTRFEFVTRTAGYAPGQLATANYAPFNLNNTQMLIESVQAGDQVDGINLWYRVVAIAGPYDTFWVAFFSKLLTTVAMANAINVGVSQQTTTLANFTGSVSPTATYTATVFACPIPSTTLFPSSTLYPC